MQIHINRREAKIFEYLLNSLMPAWFIFIFINNIIFCGLVILSVLSWFQVIWSAKILNFCFGIGLSTILLQEFIVSVVIFLIVFAIIAKNDNGISLRKIFHKQKP